MKTKKINKKKVINFSSSTVYLLHLSILLLSLIIFKLYILTGSSELLVLTIFISSGSVISLIFILYSKVKNYLIDKGNPLYLFKTRNFENWLVNSGFCKVIDETTIEIPNILISMKKNDYYLDIQELYTIGDKLLESSSAINSYAHQQNCDITIIECYRFKGFIRFHFIKLY